MQVRYTLIAEGPGPAEKVVGVRTDESRQEEVVISNHSVHGNGLDVGMPLRREAGRVLIELPRESLTGRWRI